MRVLENSRRLQFSHWLHAADSVSAGCETVLQAVFGVASRHDAAPCAERVPQTHAVIRSILFAANFVHKPL